MHGKTSKLIVALLVVSIASFALSLLILATSIGDALPGDANKSSALTASLALMIATVGVVLALYMQSAEYRRETEIVDGLQELRYLLELMTARCGVARARIGASRVAAASKAAAAKNLPAGSTGGATVDSDVDKAAGAPAGPAVGAAGSSAAAGAAPVPDYPKILDEEREAILQIMRSPAGRFLNYIRAQKSVEAGNRGENWRTLNSRLGSILNATTVEDAIKDIVNILRLLDSIETSDIEQTARKIVSVSSIDHLRNAEDDILVRAFKNLYPVV